MVVVVRRRRGTGVGPHRHQGHRAGWREGSQLCLTVVDITGGGHGGAGGGGGEGGGHSGHQVTGRSVRVY